MDKHQEAQISGWLGRCHFIFNCADLALGRKHAIDKKGYIKEVWTGLLWQIIVYKIQRIYP